MSSLRLYSIRDVPVLEPVHDMLTNEVGVSQHRNDTLKDYLSTMIGIDIFIFLDQQTEYVLRVCSFSGCTGTSGSKWLYAVTVCSQGSV